MVDTNKSELRKISRQDIEFIDDTSQALLDESTPWSHMLLWIIITFIICFVIWASNTVIDERTTAYGRVIPSSSIQVVQNLEGGILSKINVREGDVVEKDQELLRIDDTRFASNYKEGRAKYVDLLATIARLRSEADGLNKIDYPESVLENATPKMIEEENRLFAARQEQLQSSLATLNKSYQLAKEELQITKPLVAEGLMSQLELLRLERTVNDLQGKIDLQVDNFRSEARTELNEKEAELAGLSQQLLTAEDRMLRTVVRSPVKGTVKKINIGTIGGIIKPGMDIMEIVPYEDSLLIEAKIKPSDIGFIRPGQEANVKVTAYDFAIYGGLDGVVEYISADTISEEGRDQETYYKMLVRTQKNYLGDNKPLPILPGMVVTVDILTGEKSIMDYLLKPFKKASQQALRER